MNKRLFSIALISAIIVIVFFLWKNLRLPTIVPISVPPIPVPDGGGPLPDDTTTNQMVGCQSNCCNNYTEDIDENNPQANVGDCGDLVLAFQQYLFDNGFNPQGLDGAYGENTRQAHANYLNEFTGPTPNF
jgi:hypothetical protein